MSGSDNQQTNVSNSRDQRLLQETIGSDDTGQRADGECIACVIENRAKGGDPHLAYTFEAC